MNSFVFLYNLYTTEETLLIAKCDETMVCRDCSSAASVLTVWNVLFPAPLLPLCLHLILLQRYEVYVFDVIISDS
jgi:hypothetical protein